MAHQSGYNATVSFDPVLYWTNTLMQVTHWDLFYGRRQHEVPYMGGAAVADFAEGKLRWNAALVFLPPQELTADQMNVDVDEDREVTLFMNGADYWAGDIRFASYRVVAPIDGPIIATVRLLGRGTLAQTVN